MYYDVATGVATYNLSWTPHVNAKFDADYYEVSAGGLVQSVRDTSLIISVETSKSTMVNVSVVDRCSRRASAAYSIPSASTSNSTGNQPYYSFYY